MIKKVVNQCLVVLCRFLCRKKKIRTDNALTQWKRIHPPPQPVSLVVKNESKKKPARTLVRQKKVLSSDCEHAFLKEDFFALPLQYVVKSRLDCCGTFRTIADFEVLKKERKKGRGNRLQFERFPFFRLFPTADRSPSSPGTSETYVSTHAQTAISKKKREKENKTRQREKNR